jgi:hypothetical protein
MEKRINGKRCNTDLATQLGTKCEGEFGDPKGYEEKLFINRGKQYFIHGIGGPESKYPEPNIELLTNEQAAEWIKENIKTKEKRTTNKKPAKKSINKKISKKIIPKKEIKEEIKEEIKNEDIANKSSIKK